MKDRLLEETNLKSLRWQSEERQQVSYREYKQWQIQGYHYIKIIIVCPCVCPLREVSGNELTPRNKRLYLWPLSNRS